VSDEARNAYTLGGDPAERRRLARDAVELRGQTLAMLGVP
jgi:hypothetical protein